MEEESSSTTLTVVQPPQAEQEVSSVVRNVPAETSQLVGQSRGGRVKSKAHWGLA